MLSKRLFLSGVVLLVLASFLFVGSVGASSEMWSQTYESGRFQSAYSLVETSDGGYAIVGESGLDSDFCLLKTDEWGNMQWTKTYGGTNDDRAFSVVETSDGGYAIAGTTESFGAGSFDFWLVKTDVNGSMQWNRTYGGSDLEKAYSLIKTSDGGYAIAGYMQSSGARGSDFLLVKTDAYGNVEWSQTYEVERATDRRLVSLVETSDGGYALVGYIWLMMSGDTFIWAVKTDEYGIIPEFPSWTILPLLLTAILVVSIYRRRLSKTTQHSY